MHEELETVVVSYDSNTYVGHLRLNRPEALNALSGQLRDDIITGLQRLEKANEQEDEIGLRAVAIEGADGNFSVGADVNEFGESSSRTGFDRSHVKVLLEFPVPLIAKIKGYCLGGGLETALACDFRIAHEDSQFGFPEVDLGLIPGAGGIQFVSKLSNPAAAKELCMTGESIGAERAEDLGLVTNVVSDEFESSVTSFAETIASKPPLAVQAIKASADMSLQTKLKEGIEYDRAQIRSLFETEDFKEGVQAFADEEYEPDFHGR